MKKLSVLILAALFLLSACSGGIHGSFLELYDAFIARGEGVEGYEVTEIESYEGMEFFAVRICLNTDDATSVDDFVWFEANVLYFEDIAEAQAAYEDNQSFGLGGTCLQKDNILIYWLTGDYFEDLYKEVFTTVFG